MRRTLLLFLFWVVLPAAVSASPLINRTTIDEAIQAALRERPMLLAAESNLAAAESAYRASASQYLPRLTLREQFYATNEPGGSLFISLNQERLILSPTADAYNQPPDRHDFETRLSLIQPLFDPVVHYAKKRSLSRQQEAIGLLQRRREEAVFSALQAYLEVQHSRDRVAWAERSLAEAEEVLAMARERETAGVGLHTDTLRSEVLFYDAQRKLLASQNGMIMARQRLAVAMGRPEGEVDIASPLDPDWLSVPVLTGELRRGDLAALGAGVRESELAAQQQWSEYLPKASVQASYILHDEDVPFGSDGEAWSVTAGLQWTLFDFAERSHALDEARARKRTLELQKLDRERQARLEISNAVLKAEEAVALLALARSAHEASDATRVVVLERYAAGLATLSELLEVQAELARSRSDLAEAQVNQIAARARVHFQEGTLLQALKIDSEGDG